jgi:hypothetical protein
MSDSEGVPEVDVDDFGEFGLPIHAFLKNKTHQVRISENEYQGHPYVDIRLFFRTDNGAWRPTKSGLTIPPRLYPELLRGILELGVHLDALDATQLDAVLESAISDSVDQNTPG